MLPEENHTTRLSLKRIHEQPLAILATQPTQRHKDEQPAPFFPNFSHSFDRLI